MSATSTSFWRLNRRDPEEWVRILALWLCVSGFRPDLPFSEELSFRLSAVKSRKSTEKIQKKLEILRPYVSGGFPYGNSSNVPGKPSGISH
jgi:hypothetical protein